MRSVLQTAVAEDWNITRDETWCKGIEWRKGGGSQGDLKSFESCFQISRRFGYRFVGIEIIETRKLDPQSNGLQVAQSRSLSTSRKFVNCPISSKRT